MLLLKLCHVLLVLCILGGIVRYFWHQYRSPRSQQAWVAFFIAMLLQLGLAVSYFWVPVEFWEVVINSCIALSLFYGLIRMTSIFDADLLPAPPLADAVIVIDSTSVVLAWSTEAEHLFGWSATEAIGGWLPELIMPPWDRAAHVHGLERYLAAPETAHMLGRWVPVTAWHKQQFELPVEVYIDALLVEGAPPTFQGRIRRLFRV